jgi:dihydrofolate reductase
MISIIVAFDEDRAIAKNGTIPWHISEDFKHFKATTMGCSVIMGSKTWNSLPIKPLPGRVNIVMSRHEFASEAFLANSLDDALKIAEREAPGKEIFIIGGLQVYQEALASGKVAKIVVSHIKGQFGGDLFFPELTGWYRRLVQTYEKFEVYEYFRRLKPVWEYDPNQDIRSDLDLLMPKLI